MPPDSAVSVQNLSHAYGDRRALNSVSFEVQSGEIFALLGPNGGGKTTMFRILSTLMAPGSGDARIFDLSVKSDPAGVRERIGVVFQEPSLDPMLTALENMTHHGRLFGMHGRKLREEALSLLKTFGLADRAGERTQAFSGGLRRRVELAKALLPGPDLLLLDEPSTGLDPGARVKFAGELQRLRAERKTTVLLTTHFMEEADRCDRVAVLHEGKLVTIGEPDRLKEEVHGEVIVIQTPDPEGMGEKLRERFGYSSLIVDGALRLEHPRAHEFIPQLVEAFPGEVKSLTLGKPTLEDVFVQKTGTHFWRAGKDASSGEEGE